MAEFGETDLHDFVSLGRTRRVARIGRSTARAAEVLAAQLVTEGLVHAPANAVILAAFGTRKTASAEVAKRITRGRADEVTTLRFALVLFQKGAVGAKTAHRGRTCIHGRTVTSDDPKRHDRQKSSSVIPHDESPWHELP